MNDVKPGVFARLSAVMVLLFLAVPIVLIFPLALSSTEYLSFPPSGFSLQWVERVLSNDAWISSLWLSTKIALGATVVTVVISILTALALVRANFPGKQIIYALILLPMIVPAIISAVAMFFFFATLDFLSSTIAIIIGHVVISIPIAVIIISSTLQGMDTRLEWAAMSMGADRFTAFRRVTLPLAAPGIASACIFAFLSSFDELLIAMFVADSTVQTLPVRIWNSVLFQLDPTIAAVSALLVIMAILALLAVSVLSKK